MSCPTPSTHCLAEANGVLRIGSTAPNFLADSQLGTFDFHTWIGNHWVILFSHPADFTPVCTTELGALAKLQEQFAQRNAKIIGLSIDTTSSHRGK